MQLGDKVTTIEQMTVFDSSKHYESQCIILLRFHNFIINQRQQTVKIKKHEENLNKMIKKNT